MSDKYIILVGTITTGYRAVGHFNDVDSAYQYKKDLDLNGVVLEITSSADFASELS